MMSLNREYVDKYNALGNWKYYFLNNNNICQLSSFNARDKAVWKEKVPVTKLERDVFRYVEIIFAYKKNRNRNY